MNVDEADAPAGKIVPIDEAQNLALADQWRTGEKIEQGKRLGAPRKHAACEFSGDEGMREDVTRLEQSGHRRVVAAQMV